MSPRNSFRRNSTTKKEHIKTTTLPFPMKLFNFLYQKQLVLDHYSITSLSIVSEPLAIPRERYGISAPKLTLHKMRNMERDLSMEQKIYQRQ